MSMRREMVIIAAVVVVLLGVWAILNEPSLTGFTGFAVLDSGIAFNENSTFALDVNVTSLRVSGSYLGLGNAKLYLGEALVLDTALVNGSFENVCVESCSNVVGNELTSVVEGNMFVVITGFNYTVAGLNQTIGNVTNITLPNETNLTFPSETNISKAPRAQPKVELMDKSHRDKGRFVIVNETDEDDNDPDERFTVELHSSPGGFSIAAAESSVV